jgi:hypothetical protein
MNTEHIGMYFIFMIAAFFVFFPPLVALVKYGLLPEYLLYPSLFIGALSLECVFYLGSRPKKEAKK